MKLMVIIFSLFALCCNICTAQNKIEGRVTFIGNTPVENAIIVVKALTDKGERIVANTTTNKQGLYAVTLSSDNKRLVLYVSGFDINTLRKEIANTPQTIDFVAEPRNFELQEVFVKPTSIEAKGDTLTYNIALFKDKNDRILRETLERMPGISVNDAGKVLYNGREITEFQIEGNNLFENKYSIALDRIDPKDIVAVYCQQDHSHTFLSNLKAYYRTKTAEWSLSIHNLLNAKKLSMTSVNAQERERNTFYLVPRNLILSLNLIL